MWRDFNKASRQAQQPSTPSAPPALTRGAPTPDVIIVLLPSNRLSHGRQHQEE